MAKIVIVYIVFILFCVISEAQLPKEAYATVPSLISSAGYPVEKYRVITEDDYILKLFRIPAGRRIARRTNNSKGKKAVLLVHGLMGCSSNFVIMGPDRSLAYMLADAGYDVWLANLRGNIYTAHKTLSRDDPNFWKFSFHEHGKYDVPAIIDKILEDTGLSKILYIGHSMGCTSFFVMLSERPEYNEKILSFIGLAPAVYISRNRLIEVTLEELHLTTRLRSQGMVTSNLGTDMWKIIANNVCRTKKPQDNLCVQVTSMLMGEDFEQCDMDMLPIYMARVQPSSWRQLEHFGKVALTNVFTAWENGLNGTIRPYKLNNTNVPVVLLYGENDLLTEKSQILRLANELQPTGMVEEARAACSWPKFNHIDFIFAKDVATLLNKPLVKVVQTLYNKYGS